MPEISQGRALAYVVAVLLVLLVEDRYLLGVGHSAETTTLKDVAFPEDQVDPALRCEAEPVVGWSLVAQVVGAIRKSGLYELAEGSRGDDAIEHVGGLTKGAALEGVNLGARWATDNRS